MTILVAAAVVRKGDQILLTRRPSKAHLGGMWEFPGGKVEADEDPKDAVVRECLEECGIRLIAGDILDVVFHRYETKSVLLLFYDCRLAEGETGDVAHLGVTEHAWVTPDTLDDYPLPPADKPLVAKLQAR